MSDNTDIVDSVVNAGKTAWDIMKDGKAVSSAQTSFCSALPKGVKNSDLFGWKNASDKWTVELQNYYGVNVVEVDFICSYDWGGHTKENPNAMYLTNFGVYCKVRSLSWGFSFDSKATVKGMPVNYGSADKPNWGVPLIVSFKATGMNSKGNTWRILASGLGKYQRK